MFDRNKNRQSETKTESVEVPEKPFSAPSSMNNRRSAVIGSTISIKGEVTGEEDLIIEGKVEGTITLKSNTVTVGATGKVNANINAKIIKVDGEVQGDMNGLEQVIISKAGRVRGNIVSPRVSLEDGALFKGSIDMEPATGKTTELPLSAVSQSKAKDNEPQQQAVPFSAKSGN